MITSFLANISVSMQMSSFNVIMGKMAEEIVGKITRLDRGLQKSIFLLFVTNMHNVISFIPSTDNFTYLIFVTLRHTLVAPNHLNSYDSTFFPGLDFRHLQCHRVWRQLGHCTQTKGPPYHTLQIWCSDS